jgi:hypothetical protein
VVGARACTGRHAASEELGGPRVEDVLLTHGGARLEMTEMACCGGERRAYIYRATRACVRCFCLR